MIVPTYKLAELGFERYVYEDQTGKPVFFKMEIGNVTIEVSKDGKLGQWTDGSSPYCAEGISFDIFNLDDDQDATLFADFVMAATGIDIAV